MSPKITESPDSHATWGRLFRRQYLMRVQGEFVWFDVSLPFETAGHPAMLAQWTRCVVSVLRDMEEAARIKQTPPSIAQMREEEITYRNGRTAIRRKWR